MTILSLDRSKGYIEATPIIPSGLVEHVSTWIYEVDNNLHAIWRSSWGHDAFPSRNLACDKEWYDALKAPRCAAKQPVLTFEGALSELL